MVCFLCSGCECNAPSSLLIGDWPVFDMGKTQLQVDLEELLADSDRRRPAPRDPSRSPSPSPLPSPKVESNGTLYVLADTAVNAALTDKRADPVPGWTTRELELGWPQRRGPALQRGL